MAKWNVGQQVVVVCDDHSRSTTKTAVITKVGRKYVTVLDAQFGMDGCEKVDCGYARNLYTEAEHVLLLRIKVAHEQIRNYFEKYRYSPWQIPKTEANATALERAARALETIE